ncbi:hypothetical protein V1508DRAFT_411482 [Lipomyces doorenjongii]|uniref:uncharacterized protein n=1 Tax=Lipomyces doorenjongii TaxID=383834 RepID=UPI0034CE8FA8
MSHRRSFPKIGRTHLRLCDLSLASTGTLRRHLRDYHRRAVVAGRRGAPRAVGRRLIAGSTCGAGTWTERSRRGGASARGPVTATLAVQVLGQKGAGGGVHPPVVRSLQHWWCRTRSSSRPCWTKRSRTRLVGTTQVASLSAPALKNGNVDEVPRVGRFLKDCQLYAASKRTQNVQFPWLPIGIDSAELISPEFSEDDWQDEVQRGMREFVQFHVLHMVGPRDVRTVPANSPLEFEAFAMFDREWAREVWELVRDDFRTHVVDVLDSASRSQYLGLWLLVPWILGSLVYRLHGIRPAFTR